MFCGQKRKQARTSVEFEDVAFLEPGEEEEAGPEWVVAGLEVVEPVGPVEEMLWCEEELRLGGGEGLAGAREEDFAEPAEERHLEAVLGESEERRWEEVGDGLGQGELALAAADAAGEWEAEGEFGEALVVEEWRVAGDAGGDAVGVGVAEERVLHVETGVEESCRGASRAGSVMSRQRSSQLRRGWRASPRNWGETMRRRSSS